MSSASIFFYRAWLFLCMCLLLVVAAYRTPPDYGGCKVCLACHGLLYAQPAAIWRISSFVRYLCDEQCHEVPMRGAEVCSIFVPLLS